MSAANTTSEQNLQASPRRAGRARVMWNLLRPHTLTASFIPVLIGSELAWRRTGRLHLALMLAMLAASMLIQTATNIFNEFFDYMRGLDTAESVGIGGAITQHGMNPRTIFRIAIGCLLAAVLLGIYICAHSSWWLVAIGAISMLMGYLYTGGPHPIASTPFGEIFAGGFMGGGIILIACFVQQGFVAGADVLVSIPSAILVGAILTANNIRDREGDERSGRRTLVILLGHKKAVIFLACCLVAANLWAVALIVASVLPLRALLVLGSLLPAAAAVRIFRAGGTPPEMMPGMQRVAQTNTVFGLLLLLGLV